MTQGCPCTAVELRTTIDNDWSGEDELKPACSREIEKSDPPVRHGDHEDRQCEHSGENELEPQVLVLLAARAGMRIFGVRQRVGLRRNDCIVAGASNRSHDRVEIRHRGIELNGRALGCEIHRCLLHTLGLIQRTLNSRGAGGAGHAGYGKIDALRSVIRD